MPKYSGYERASCSLLSAVTQMIPVIIVSGKAGAQTREYRTQLGAVAYFEKPIDFDALRSCLSQLALRKPQIPREEVSVQLRVPWKLRGMDINKKK
jgi:DNA-binding NtrC family response regulator